MGKSAINPAVVGKHSTDIAALKNDLGIVEDGDTATHTIAQGQYVIWQGALYTADAAIASGTTLAASGGNKNLTAVENGGLNALNSKSTSTVTPATNATVSNSYVAKQLQIVYARGTIQKNVTANQWNKLGSLSDGYKPDGITNIAIIDGTNDTDLEGKIEGDGNIYVWPKQSGTANFSFAITFIQ